MRGTSRKIVLRNKNGARFECKRKKTEITSQKLLTDDVECNNIYSERVKNHILPSN